MRDATGSTGLKIQEVPTPGDRNWRPSACGPCASGKAIVEVQVRDERVSVGNDEGEITKISPSAPEEEPLVKVWSPVHESGVPADQPVKVVGFPKQRSRHPK